MSLLSNTAIKKILSETQTWSASQNYQDNAKLLFGESGGDLDIYHDGSNSYIQDDGTGSLNIMGSEINLKQENGGSGVTYLQIDPSNTQINAFKNMVLLDSVELRLGTGYDTRMHHNDTLFTLENYKGDIKIQQNADDESIIFQNDNGSGGVTTYVEISGEHSRTKFAEDMQLLDGKKLYFGSTSTDASIHWDDGGADFKIATVGGELYLESAGNVYVKLDTNNNTSNFLRIDDGAGNEMFKFNESGHMEVGINSSAPQITLGTNGDNNSILKFVGDINGNGSGTRQFVAGLDYSDNSFRLNAGSSFDGTLNGMLMDSSGNVNFSGDITFSNASPNIYFSSGSDANIQSNAGYNFRLDLNENGSNSFKISIDDGGSGDNPIFTANEDSSFVITSYDAGAGVSPTLKFIRNSSSPADNDLIGEIIFNGEDDASNSQDYAKIHAKLLDVSSGSEDSDMRFFTLKNGTETERFRISNSGVDVFGTMTSSGNYTVSKDGGSAIQLTATTSSSNSFTNAINFVNQTGGSGIRGQGLFFTDSDMTNEEWFIGVPYSASFNMVQIGFDGSGGQSEYQAKAIMQFIDNGTKSARLLDDSKLVFGSEDDSLIEWDNSNGQLDYRSNGHHRFTLDDDNNGTSWFYINNGADTTMFAISETEASFPTGNGIRYAYRVSSNYDFTTAVTDDGIKISTASSTRDIMFDLNSKEILRLLDTQVTVGSTDNNIPLSISRYANSGTYDDMGVIRPNHSSGGIVIDSHDGSGFVRTLAITKSQEVRLEQDSDDEGGTGAKFSIGAGHDLKMWHSGTNSYLHNDTGSLYIENNTTGDMIFKTGSGTPAEFMRLDTSATRITTNATFTSNTAHSGTLDSFSGDISQLAHDQSATLHATADFLGGAYSSLSVIEKIALKSIMYRINIANHTVNFSNSDLGSGLGTYTAKIIYEYTLDGSNYTALGSSTHTGLSSSGGSFTTSFSSTNAYPRGNDITGDVSARIRAEITKTAGADSTFLVYTGTEAISSSVTTRTSFN